MAARPRCLFTQERGPAGRIDAQIHRNFAIFTPCDFIAAITQHIPDKSKIPARRCRGASSSSGTSVGKPAVLSAARLNGGIRRFRITHPFHPLRGLEFEALEERQAFRRHVFVFLDPEGRKIQVPTAWTDAAAPDPFLAISRARAHLRVEDLLRMEELIRGNRP